MSSYHFHTGYEPSTSFGKRGIHFPDGWEITLRRFENTAPAGEPPAFVETGRIESVTAQQIADGLKDRSVRWRDARELAGPKQSRDGVREGDAPGIGKASDVTCVKISDTEARGFTRPREAPLRSAWSARRRLPWPSRVSGSRWSSAAACGCSRPL